VEAVNPVPLTIFGVALAETPVKFVLLLIAAAIAIALAARVEEVAVVSDAVSSVVKAWPMATPLIIIVELSSRPVVVVAGAAVLAGDALKNEVINAVSAWYVPTRKPLLLIAVAPSAPVTVSTFMLLPSKV